MTTAIEAARQLIAEAHGLFVTAGLDRPVVETRRPTLARWTPTGGEEENVCHLLRPGGLQTAYCGLDVQTGAGTWRIPWTTPGGIEKKCVDALFAEYEAANTEPEMGASPEPGVPDATDQAATAGADANPA